MGKKINLVTHEHDINHGMLHCIRLAYLNSIVENVVFTNEPSGLFSLYFLGNGFVNFYIHIFILKWIADVILSMIHITQEFAI